MKKETVKKFKKAQEKNPKTKFLYEYEKQQEHYNFERGRIQGLREKDTWHAVLIWTVAIGGFILGFYYATLYFAVNYCN